MAAKLFHMPFPTAFNSNGLAVPGAKLYFYVSGTSTPQNVYSDSGLTVPHPFPVLANGAGRFEDVYLDDTLSYRLVIRSGTGALLEDIDPYIPTTLIGQKGDPGGNIMAVGLFTQGSTLTIPTGTDLIQTSGYGVVGRGAAEYTYDAAVNAAYVTANPRTSFVSANGRGFKLSSVYRTPKMFGAVGDGVADDAVPLQAFFNDAFSTTNAANCLYDTEGNYGVSVGIIAAYSSSPTQLRTFMGNMTLTSTTGVDIQYGLTIAGYNQHWLGNIEVVGGSSATAWASRGFQTGIRLFNTNGSRYGGFYGRAVQRHVVLFDPKSTSETFQSGTPYQVTQGYSNNIGITIDYIQGYFCGSNFSNDTHSQRLTITGNTQEGSASSLSQRSLLTVGDTSKVQVGDFGFTSLEKLPASYGTIAFDNPSGTIIRSVGDFTADGFLVGDLVHFVDTAGTNRAYEFRVTAVGTTTLTVFPKPVTEAARVGTMFRTKPRLHRVEEVTSATQIRVMPWVDSRITSGTWRSTTGGILSSQGPNTANIRVGTVYGLGGGITLQDGGLYGIHVKELLGESGSITYMTANTTGDAGIGRKVGHVHSEASFLDYVQVSASSGQSTAIGNHSAWGTRSLPAGDNWQNGPFTRMMTLGPASNTTNGLPVGQMRNLEFASGRYRFASIGDSWGTGIGTTAGITLTNRPESRVRHQVTNVANITVTLDYDQALADMSPDHHWAQYYWEKQGGIAPTTSLTFQLASWMVTEGWTLPTVSSWSAPGSPLFFRIVFNSSTKQVSIVPFNSGYFLQATATYNPPSLAAGAKDAIQTTAVTGAALGDIVTASFSLDLAGANIRAWVSAANTVSWYFVNENGANPLDLASGTVKLRVHK